MIFDNSAAPSSLIAEGYLNGEIAIIDTTTFEKLKNHDKTG